MNADFCHDVIENLSLLEGFARRLAGDHAFADDLVQETGPARAGACRQVSARNQFARLAADDSA